MGWTQQKAELFGFTSSHNSDQDRKDHADWLELMERIEQITREHRYADLNIQFHYSDY